jgi:hypothetical protein
VSTTGRGPRPGPGPGYRATSAEPGFTGGPARWPGPLLALTALAAAWAARYRYRDISAAAAGGGFGAMIARAGADGPAARQTTSALLTFRVGALTISRRFR